MKLWRHIVMVSLVYQGANWVSAGTDQPAAAALRTDDGYAVPQPVSSFDFPRTHGSHPEFKIEWWYVTGHLWTPEKRRFGFQATFFRRAGPRERFAVAGVASEAFGRDQIFLAHMAVLDVESGKFLHRERLHREGWNAGAATNGLSAWNGDWLLHMDDDTEEVIRLRGGVGAEADFSLTLRPAKPLVVFGEEGVSRKAADPTAASHYLTFTRLAAEGTLRLGELHWPVSGLAWMDHEISSSQLGEGQVGWDWAALQLEDGREIMAYRMRRANGEADPYSTLAWIDREGGVTHVKASEFRWRGLGQWPSPQTGATYPLPVRLEVNDPLVSRESVFVLQPLSMNQELTGEVGGIAYWEGACRVLNERGDEIGSAFVELTGYAGSLRDRFR